MRLLKPLLAAAAVLAIAAPAASALADPSWVGYREGYHRAYDGDGGGWRYRQAQRQEAWRYFQARREHQAWERHRWELRHEGWGY